LRGTNSGAINRFKAAGFRRGNGAANHPSVMFRFLALPVGFDGRVPAGGDGYRTHEGPMYLNSLASSRVTLWDVRDEPAFTLG
jgi:hypothetical protein